MTQATVFEVVTTDAYNTRNEALEFRKKLLHPHLYGVYGICRGATGGQWVVLPIKVLKVLWEYQEKDGV